MRLLKVLWFLHYWKYSKVRKRLPRPTESEWISMNTDGLDCPLSRVYTQDEAEKLFENFQNVSSFTKEFGWFRIVLGKKPTT